MSKTVIITGSQGNLGNAVTKKFTDEGYKVIGTVEPGKSRNQSGEQVTYHEIDLQVAEAVEQWAGAIMEEVEILDSIVCLVGGFGMAGIADADKTDIDKMISLNFYTAFNVIRSFLSKTKDQGIPVNVVLIGAKPAIEKGGSKGVFPYALSKTMVIQLAESINADDLNAHATVVVPSIIDTPPNREAMPDTNFSDWVTPASLADKIYFACSEAGRDLRGTVLKVYGGV